MKARRKRLKRPHDEAAGQPKDGRKGNVSKGNGRPADGLAAEPARRKMGTPKEAQKERSWGFDEKTLRLARLVRAAYVHCRSLAESARRAVAFKYEPPAVYDRGDPGGNERKGRPPAWPALALWLKESKVEVISYVVHCFFEVGTGKMPEPKDLMSANRLASFRHARRAEHHEVRLALEREQRAFRDAVAYETTVVGTPQDEVWGDVLTDDDVQLSPLFRYAVAHSVGGVAYQRIARYYFSAAVFQFRRNPGAYARHWGKILPPAFVKKSRRNYLRLIRNVTA